jgi:hypothetical protein
VSKELVEPLSIFENFQPLTLSVVFLYFSGNAQSPPKSCTIPSGCVSPDCMDCPLDENGEEIYSIIHSQRDVFCMSTGTRTDEEYGTWDWAVICGKHLVEFEGGVEQNRGVGEIDCQAVRYGENLSYQNGGLVSGILPCQFLSLLTCQCAPDDVFTFGLAEPLCPCQNGKLELSELLFKYWKHF